MTGLSRGRLARTTNGRRRGLAWLSLLVPGVVPFTTGCFDAPPEYKVADHLPPVISSWGVTPSLTSINVMTWPHGEVQFTVPFRSDDAGEDLKAFFVENIPQQVDYRSPTCQTCDFIDEIPVPADPRPFAEQKNRLVSLPSWPTTGKIGCSTVTMILSHETNFIRGWQMRDSLDSAQVTWIFDFLDQAGTSPGCGAAAAGVTP